jgi:hypothetical protein
VSCVSPIDCTAVGSYYISSTQHIWAESWNGKKWQTQTVASP